MDEYVTEMVERAGEEVKMSIGNTEMMHDWDRFLNSPFFRMGGHATQTNKQALNDQKFQEVKVGEAKT